VIAFGDQRIVSIVKIRNQTLKSNYLGGDRRYEGSVPQQLDFKKFNINLDLEQFK